MWVATQTRAYPQWRCRHDSDPLECLSHVPYLLYFQSRAHSFALFCAPQKLNAFIFKRFRTLRQKNSTTGRGEGDNSLAENTAKVSVATSLLHYILASSPERKQHRLGGRTIGDGLEFRVLPLERL